MWLIGAMVCLLAAPWVQLSVSAGNGWPHNALRHHWLMPIGCHFRDCKALLVTSLTHVSGAIASVQTFTFYLYVHTPLTAAAVSRSVAVDIVFSVLFVCNITTGSVFLLPWRRISPSLIAYSAVCQHTVKIRSIPIRGGTYTAP